jgi:hypothetical protein
VTAGTLPPGLSLSTAGVLSGTPTAASSGSFTVTVTDALGQTASKSLTISIVAAPTLNGSVGDGVAGVAYTAALSASGGTQPYSFAVASGGLPDGLSLSATSGAIGGTPSKPGAFSFTIRVSDSAQPPLSATRAFTINIAPPALPTVSVTQLSDTATPASQPAFGVTLGQAYPLDLTGTATLTFKPASGPVDPAVVFANGQTTMTFSLPAGQTSATAGGTMAFQTGTTAGTITITIVLSAGGVALNPNPAAMRTITIANAAPVITSVAVGTTSAGFNITALGYSNTREIVSATVTFTASAGASLATSTFSVPVSSAFQTWFAGSPSASFGGQFLLTIPFTVSQGSASSLASVQVTLTNGVGSGSGSGSGTF